MIDAQEEMRMANGLKKYFPMIRTREEILDEISGNEILLEMYRKWDEKQRREFLDFCTGVKGVKILYDSFFKEIMDPDAAPERLEEFLSLILKQQVKILNVLPNDSTRIAEESTLVIMDIVIELADHSIANVKVQKLEYMFPGQRAACYSSDLLLRQYKRVKCEKGKSFSYRDIKKVYTIILYEKSPREFHQFPEQYIHWFKQTSDSGIDVDLLQEYIFLPLDIFCEILHNNGIRNRLEAWLAFLSVDEPEMIEMLIDFYPQFQTYYREIYELCRNMEKVMGMFSKELLELDKNTVQYMIDEMQNEIDAQKGKINEQEGKISEQEGKISEQEGKLSEQERLISEQKGKLSEQEQMIADLRVQIEQMQKGILPHPSGENA